LDYKRGTDRKKNGNKKKKDLKSPKKCKEGGTRVKMTHWLGGRGKRGSVGGKEDRTLAHINAKKKEGFFSREKKTPYRMYLSVESYRKKKPKKKERRKRIYYRKSNLFVHLGVKFEHGGNLGVGAVMVKTGVEAGRISWPKKNL